jgi:hypothetical protein
MTEQAHLAAELSATAAKLAASLQSTASLQAAMQGQMQQGQQQQGQQQQGATLGNGAAPQGQAVQVSAPVAALQEQSRLVATLGAMASPASQASPAGALAAAPSLQTDQFHSTERQWSEPTSAGEQLSRQWQIGDGQNEFGPPRPQGGEVIHNVPVNMKGPGCDLLRQNVEEATRKVRGQSAMRSAGLRKDDRVMKRLHAVEHIADAEQDSLRKQQMTNVRLLEATAWGDEEHVSMVKDD